MPQTRTSPVALVARTILWILISTVFLIAAFNRVARMRASGLRPTTWAYAQIAIWCVALAFWLYTGWRDWTRRTP